jgi:hypothetical protein
MMEEGDVGVDASKDSNGVEVVFMSLRWCVRDGETVLWRWTCGC